MNIIISTTATRRHELLEQTYCSFLSRLAFARPTALVLNIDPIGTSTNEQVLEVANRYFPIVVCREAEECNFALAVKFVLSEAAKIGDYVFHLEDDWTFPLNITADLITQPFRDSKVNQVSLKAWPNNKNRFCLSPNLMRSSFASEVASILNGDKNPETQIREYLKGRADTECLYLPKTNLQYATDMGREWASTFSHRRPVSPDWNQWGEGADERLIALEEYRALWNLSNPG